MNWKRDWSVLGYVSVCLIALIVFSRSYGEAAPITFRQDDEPIMYSNWCVWHGKEKVPAEYVYHGDSLCRQHFLQEINMESK